MWKTFTVDDDTYMLQIIKDDTKYKINFSDLKEIWSKEYSKDDIIEQFQESNPAFVVEDEEAVSQTIMILNGIDTATIAVNKTDNGITLKVKSEILGISDTKFKLKYDLHLLKEDSNKFTEVLVVPMIHTIIHLEKQQAMLCDVLRKKDRELEEYKMEKGSISRGDLTTDKFDVSCLKTPSDKLLLNTYTQNKFLENIVNKYGAVQVEVMDAKVEPWNHVKRKRKTYNAKTSKKLVKGVSYKKKLND